MRNLESRLRKLEPPKNLSPNRRQWLSVIVHDDETEQQARDRALAGHLRLHPESNPAGRYGYILRIIVSPKPPEQAATR